MFPIFSIHISINRLYCYEICVFFFKASYPTRKLASNKTWIGNLSKTWTSHINDYKNRYDNTRDSFNAVLWSKTGLKMYSVTVKQFRSPSNMSDFYTKIMQIASSKYRGLILFIIRKFFDNHKTLGEIIWRCKQSEKNVKF